MMSNRPGSRPIPSDAIARFFTPPLPMPALGVPPATLAEYLDRARFPLTTRPELSPRQQFLADSYSFKRLRAFLRAGGTLTDRKRAQLVELEAKEIARPTLLAQALGPGREKLKPAGGTDLPAPRATLPRLPPGAETAMPDDTATPTPPDDGEHDPELVPLWIVGATAIVTLVAVGLIDTAGKAIAGAITFAVLTAVGCLPWPPKWDAAGTPDGQATGNGQLDEPPAQAVAQGCRFSDWGPDSTLVEGMADGRTCPLSSGHDSGQIVRQDRVPGSSVPSGSDRAITVRHGTADAAAQTE